MKTSLALLLFVLFMAGGEIIVHQDKLPPPVVRVDNRKPIQAPLDCLDLQFRFTRMGVNLRGKRRCV